MRLSAHLLAAAWLVGLATAATPVPAECWSPNLSLNATNVDTLANCTLYSYQCFDNDEGVTFVTTSPPPTNCMKLKSNVFFDDYNMTGALVVPRMVETQQLSIQGQLTRDSNSSGGIDRTVRPLRVDSIEFPDLANITEFGGISVMYAHNLSSVKFPKLENMRGTLDLDLSEGPAISLSFPNLRLAFSGIWIKGKIDALDFPVLNFSRAINITSTGNLDCVAFAATVVNTTTWPTGYKETPESLFCTSNKNSINTHPVPAEESGSSGMSWFRGDLLLLVVLVGGVSLVV